MYPGTLTEEPQDVSRNAFKSFMNADEGVPLPKGNTLKEMLCNKTIPGTF
jgi:hypothetical protein